MSEFPINVLIVEHAEHGHNLLMEILEGDPDIRVIGRETSARNALKLINHTKPDLIIVDISLPHGEGLDLTRELMENNPIPIVVVGNAAGSIESSLAFDLLQAGALATIEKPLHDGVDGINDLTQNLVSTVKTMAEIKLVRRIRHRQPSNLKKKGRCAENDGNENTSSVDLVAIGASTGGPGVIQSILKSLPNDFPAPILIAQHIAPGFTDGLVHWLATTTGFSVKVCGNNDKLMPSCAYLCPEGFQTSLSSNLRVRLSEDARVNGVRPSVSYLFSSLCELPKGRVIAVLLTGMGKDGAEELKMLKDKGGVTIVQDAESSLVHGMPGEAIKLGAAVHVVSAQKIPDLLVELTGPKKRLDSND